MRGRKIDSKFVGEFITECVESGKTNADEFIHEAKLRIENIDQKILEVEKLKLIRSKLIDVILTFDNSVKDKSDEKEMLHFFELKVPNICIKIAYLVSSSKLKIKDIVMDHSKEDIYFAVKQLLEYDILNLENEYLVPSVRFKEFLHYNSC